ncbi:MULTISPECIES: hypothetical protein [Rhizobium/Agrobacterium group]|uniref:hypothetical protein n=1 Tax=Rhizobium/Agrobacterium group TaxID=227290 RepID=UPI0023000833|nr:MULTISPECIES: hypothetical protein [Rhizobium/Agrobacterium group]MDA5634802.1 hypothetical protein [Agrobacterium sp. ST15.16.024]MDF1890747.1 hypothetical protein [Rhizobium rhizogenes]
MGIAHNHQQIHWALPIQRNDAHLQCLSCPEPAHDGLRKTTVRNCEVLPEKKQSSLLGNFADKKLRQRFLQQFIMGRQFPLCRKSGQKPPSPKGDDRIGGKAHPEEDGALPVRAPDEGHDGPEQGEFGSRLRP